MHLAELKLSNQSPMAVELFYRNWNVSFMWYDRFTTMMDKVSTFKFQDIMILGNFNINLRQENLTRSSNILL